MMDNSVLIFSLLEKYGIEYWLTGKNVSVDAVGITCPFCSDTSNHCGIFKNTLLFKCWKCSQTGSFAYLLSVLTDRPKDICRQEIDDSTATFLQDPETQIREIFEPTIEEEKEDVSNLTCDFPKYSESLDPTFALLQYYLMERDFSLATLQKYQCKICRVGSYMNRLIIPIYFEDELVSFQGADMTLKAEVKYKTEVSEVNRYLYNWDNLDLHFDYLILTEGILDAWRLGENSLATFGTTLSKAQFELILCYNPKKLIFAWDSDAFFVAEREAQKFEPFIDEVYTISFPEGEDPDSYGHEASWKLIEQESGLCKRR